MSASSAAAAFPGTGVERADEAARRRFTDRLRGRQ
jgi:hypothetical protein